MEFLREDDDFSKGEDFLIESAQLTLDIIRQQVERPVLTRRARITRDRLGAHARLVEDYFSENPKYPEDLFRHRFRMSPNLFSRVRDDLEQNYDFFQQRCDGRGKIGFSGLQKCTSAIRQLAYGTSSDSLYAKKYLRKPNSHDIQQIYTFHDEVQGFPGDHPRPSFMLEAVASQDLWIWHAFFGASGSNNDINVLDQSPIYNDLIEGKAPGQQFICNDTTYKYGYYLVDGIYPQWATFVKSFTSRQTADEKRLYFQNRQEGARKDIERAFGVLKHKWHMIQHPGRSRIRNALYACVILHNMIIEDNGRAICEFYEEDEPNLLEHVEINDE
ncbi:hypothetical protein E3N88_37132 [Mikania micrantha]|uniref:DDE Tnp4 domain-containing protein n=1 Tax=Mikania micrantha TaxID=192012 RepID=A0A5N6M672_9ASTR|nr:hypothetical protein E3N88_37132 [Mikania micrantha]